MKTIKLIYNNDAMRIFKAVLPPIGVNTYYILMDETLLVTDPGIGASDLLKEIETDFKNIAILITHSHLDHIAGIDEFPNEDILISKEALPGLYDPFANLSADFGGNPVIVQNEKTIILEHGTASYKGISFNVALYPGHTQGDTIFDFGDFIVTGDFIFCDSIGRTDFRHSSEDEMEKSLKRFKRVLSEKAPSTLILPGHMGHCKAQTLLEKNPFLNM